MLKDFKINILFGTSLGLLALALLFTGIRFYGVDSSVILHFDSAGRADLVGEINNVFNISGIAIVIIVLNWVLSWKLYEKNKIFAYVFATISLVVSLMALSAVYLISVIN